MYPVLLIQFPQYLCRNPRHDAVIRHITVYDRSSRNDTVFPMVTPPQIVALEQIQLPLPMWIGFAYSRSWKPSGYCCGRRSSERNGWNHFSRRRCFLFFIHSGVRLNLSQVSIPNEWYFPDLCCRHCRVCRLSFFPSYSCLFLLFWIAYLILLSPEMSAHFLL